MTVHFGRQGKHIRGAAEYIVGRSYLVVDDPKEGLKMAQDIVDKYHGTGGLRINPKSGVWHNQEVVTTDSVVGYSLNRDGKWVSPKAVKIHYSKYGTHIVPTIIREG